MGEREERAGNEREGRERERNKERERERETHTHTEAYPICTLSKIVIISCNESQVYSTVSG